jgi:hypothetical protein
MSSAVELNGNDVLAILADYKFNMMRLCITTDIDNYRNISIARHELEPDPTGQGDNHAELVRDTQRGEANWAHN